MIQTHRRPEAHTGPVHRQDRSNRVAMTSARDMDVQKTVEFPHV